MTKLWLNCCKLIPPLIQLLNSSLEDGQHGELLIAHPQMIEAFGGAHQVTQRAE